MSSSTNFALNYEKTNDTQGLMALSLAFMLFTACTKQAENQNNSAKEMADSTSLMPNVDSLIQVIDLKRSETEGLAVEPLVLTTDSMREKLRQKWSKIHFYISNQCCPK